MILLLKADIKLVCMIIITALNKLVSHGLKQKKGEILIIQERKNIF